MACQVVNQHLLSKYMNDARKKRNKSLVSYLPQYACCEPSPCSIVLNKSFLKRLGIAPFNPENQFAKEIFKIENISYVASIRW